MKKCAPLLFAILLPSIFLAQCFSGLDSIYCDNVISDSLTPLHPGGYFTGTGVSGDGVYFPSFAGTGTYTVYYSNTNYYDVDTTGIFSPVAGAGTAVTLPDDGFSEGLDIGFTFEFFGSVKNFVRIHSNGFISFDFAPAIFPPYANDIPTPGMPTDFIAAAWGDYDPTQGGTINYFYDGVAPNRRMIINYINLPPYDGTGNLTAQIILNETTNIIEIHTTASPDYGNEKSQGIENVDGTLGFVRPGRNNSIWEAYNDYVAFIPENCSAVTTIIAAPIIDITESEAEICSPYATYLHVTGGEIYSWLPPFNDLISATGTPGEFMFSGDYPAGDYYCYVNGSNAAGCSDMDSVALHIKDCTSISGSSGINFIEIYPNPAQSVLHINGLPETGCTISIFSADGRKMMQFFSEEINTTLSVEGMPTGIYWLQVEGDGIQVRRSFVRF